jgi:hypothetical protein
VEGRSPTCYSPVRRSCTPKGLTARLACVKHAASVRPEPGSNSPTKTVRREQNPLLTKTSQTNKPQTHQNGSGPKHTKRQHTVEFSKDDHTRLPYAVSGAVRRGVHHRTRSLPNVFPGDPGSGRPSGLRRGAHALSTASRLRLYPRSRGTRSAPAVRTPCVRSPRARRTIRTPPAGRCRGPRRPSGTSGPALAVGGRGATASPGGAGYAPLTSPRSSAGQSMGLLIPWSQVRVLPGAPAGSPAAGGPRGRESARP